MPESPLSQLDESGFDTDRRTQIAEKINYLTTSLSRARSDDLSKYSRVYPDKDLDDEQKDAADFLINNVTPEELVEVIYENPPEVFFKASIDSEIKSIKPIFEVREATDDEMALADRELVPPPGANEELFKLMSAQLSKYLKAPRVSDGLTDHTNERTPWVATVNAVLNLLDERKGDHKHKWYEKFRERWNNNKYKTNKLTTTFGYLLAVEGTLAKDSPMAKEIEAIHKNATNIVADEKDDKEQRTDKIVVELGKIVHLFSPDQPLQ